MFVYKKAGKRLFDLIISTTILVLFFPILIFLFMLIRIQLGKSCIFKQERPGLNGKIFTIYKFRTMKNMVDEKGELLADEERMTLFGSFLRRTSLDELPELINVIKGDMSLVGPRPLLIEYLPRYNSTQARRHDVKPGITGWAQINGRNALSWEQKFKFDVWYADNVSFLLDLKILFITMFAVFKQKGISAEQHVTMPKFIGYDQN